MNFPHQNALSGHAKERPMNLKEFLKTTVTGAAAGLIIPNFPDLLPAAIVQEKPPAQFSRTELIAAARDITAGQQYCALITQDEDGRSHARTMNPVPPEKDMTVWIATSTLTRKVQQIRRHPY
jgi:Pyridoxamine 5'-phosphate oxidase